MTITVEEDLAKINPVILDMYEQINNILNNNPVEEVISTVVSILFNVLDSIEDPEMQLYLAKDVETIISSFVSQKENNH